jgi:hypothetical protein
VVLGERSRARHGVVQVVDDLADGVDEVPARDVDLVEPHAVFIGNGPGVGALVIERTQGELAVKGLEVLVVG